MTQPRLPTLLDSVLPIEVLIGLLALTIALFGVSATDGPLQVALLLSAAFASLVAFKNGYTVESVGAAAVTGVMTAAYLPFCFFNLLSPVLDILYGFIGFKVPMADRPWEDDATTATLPVVPGGDRHV